MGGLVLSGPTSLLLDRIEGAHALLSATELDRAAAIRGEADRADFVAAHALVRVCAGRLLGVPPGALTLVQHCDSCTRSHGVPSLLEAPSLTVSLSHTRGLVAAAASAGPIGVDVEATGDQPLDWRVVELAASAAEFAALRQAERPQRSFLRQWVRKEALVKVGATTLDEMASVDLPIADRSPIDWHGWRLAHWYDPDGRAIGCVASRHAATVELLG